MSPRSLACAIALAALAATPLIITVPQAAHAQGLIDFLWGGTDEWGGKRQVVDFDQKYSADQVIVSFGDRRLYLITQKGKAVSYPIAVPREQSRWQGTTTVSEKKINPSWRPTPDMLKENPKLPTWVPGGHPMNPLGVRAMYLGASTYRIHGTDAPWTIGQAVSKGCIRMYNEDVLDLYPRVPVGMKVTVTWQQFNGQAVASNDGETPPPFDPMAATPGTSSKGSSRVIRNLPPPPAGMPTDLPPVSAGNAMAPPDPSTGDKPKPVAKAKAPKAKMPATAAATASTTAAATTSTAAATPLPVAAPAKSETSDPVAAATKAAAAATRAAESARAAAEIAKKAAADARKATSADGEEPGKDDAAKRAAL